MIELFAVFLQGVYRHACAGIFTDRTKAENLAASLALQDNYHTIEVVPFIADTPTPFTARDGHLSFDEPKPVFEAAGEFVPEHKR